MSRRDATTRRPKKKVGRFFWSIRGKDAGEFGVGDIGYKLRPSERAPGRDNYRKGEQKTAGRKKVKGKERWMRLPVLYSFSALGPPVFPLPPLNRSLFLFSSSPSHSPLSRPVFSPYLALVSLWSPSTSPLEITITNNQSISFHPRTTLFLPAHIVRNVFLL